GCGREERPRTGKKILRKTWVRFKFFGGSLTANEMIRPTFPCLAFRERCRSSRGAEARAPSHRWFLRPMNCHERECSGGPIPVGSAGMSPFRSQHEPKHPDRTACRWRPGRMLLDCEVPRRQYVPQCGLPNLTCRSAHQVEPTNKGSKRTRWYLFHLRRHQLAQ